MVQISNYNDGRDAFEPFLEDVRQGFRSIDVLVLPIVEEAVAQNLPMTYEDAYWDVAGRLINNADKSKGSKVTFDRGHADQAFGDVLPDVDFDTLLIDQSSWAGHRVLRFTGIQDGTKNVFKGNRPDGSEVWETIPAPVFKTLGVIKESRLSDESITRAMTKLQGYASTLRGSATRRPLRRDEDPNATPTRLDEDIVDGLVGDVL